MSQLYPHYIPIISHTHYPLYSHLHPRPLQAWRVIRHVQLAAVAIEEGEEKIQRLVVPGLEASGANLSGRCSWAYGDISMGISGTELEVPIICKAYVREYPDKIMVLYGTVPPLCDPEIPMNIMGM